MVLPLNFSVLVTDNSPQSSLREEKKGVTLLSSYSIIVYCSSGSADLSPNSGKWRIFPPSVCRVRLFFKRSVVDALERCVHCLKNVALPVNLLHEIKFERTDHISECQTDKRIKKAISVFIKMSKCCFSNLILEPFQQFRVFVLYDVLKECLMQQLCRFVYFFNTVYFTKARMAHVSRC